MLTWLRAAAIGFTTAVVIFVACGSTPDVAGSVDAGNLAPSEPPLGGRIQHRFATTTWGRSGGEARATCGFDGTLLGGKCAVLRTDGSGGFVSRLTATGYCEGLRQPITFTRTEEYCCDVGENVGDSSTGIVTAVAICLYPPGKVPPEQPQPTF